MIVESLYLLVPVLHIDTEFHAHAFNEFSRYISAGREVRLAGEGFCAGTAMRVTFDECSDGVRRKHFPKIERGWKRYPLLRFSGEFEYPGIVGLPVARADGSAVHLSPAEHLSYWGLVLPDRIDVTIQTYLCALNLAFAGVVRPCANIWYLDGERQDRHEHFVSLAHEAIEFLVESNITPHTMDPDRTINWVFAQSGMFDGYSNSPASRALNYFTRLFVQNFRNDEISDLVWALGGIEALLVEGGRSSAGQLKEKLYALFGVDPKWLRSMIDQMYSFRSSIVHGNRQLRSEFRRYELDSRRREREEYNSMLFGVGMLILLLQRAIESDLRKFEFRTIATV